MLKKIPLRNKVCEKSIQAIRWQITLEVGYSEQDLNLRQGPQRGYFYRENRQS